jgi:methionyl aminopeptidase
MDINKLQRAGEIHHTVKEKVLNFIEIHKGAFALSELCSFIEDNIRNLSDKNQINGGIAFPVGLNVNEVVAHYTPLNNEPEIIFNGEQDLIKIDYGVHIDGNIVDEAFTFTNNSNLQTIIDASQDALNNIIKMARPDTRICEIGATAEEIVSSYEFIHPMGFPFPLRPINNVCGHSIEPWNIHGKKMIYNIRNNTTGVIEAGDTLALEVYVSNGTGTTVMDEHVSHYSIKSYNNISKIESPQTKELFDLIQNKFASLPFTQRHIDYRGVNINSNLKSLVNNGNLIGYPSLSEPIGTARVAQFEKTMYVGESQTIVI